MKAIINTDNYEAFWVDYLDGKLSESDEERLFAFLETNPEISANLIDTDDFMLPAPDVKYPAKSSLKAEYQIENLLIAKIENEISSEDDKLISEKIKTEKKVAAAYSAYQKTILVPDTTIVFEGKKYLKKQTSVPLYRYVSAIAAAFALVFVSGYFLTRNQVEINPAPKAQIAKVDNTIINNDTTAEVSNNDVISTENVARVSDNSTSVPENIIETNMEHFVYVIPEKMPVISVAAVENPLRETKTPEYKFSEPALANSNSYSYSIQYVKSPKENIIKTTINKITKFGEDVNLKESYDKLKEAKEDLLFSMNQ